MIDVDFTRSSQQSQRAEADRIVGDSTQLNSIRTIIEERGMDPIWVYLIKQFGSVMYLEGRESRPPLRTSIEKIGPSPGVGQTTRFR